MMKTQVIKINSKRPNLDELRQAASLLGAGKLVAFPTETVYGIGVRADHPDAIDRLYALKGRPKDKPLAYHIGNLNFLEKLEVIQNNTFKYFVDLFWPGPVSLVVLNRRDEKIGIRYPAHLIAQELLTRCGCLILATSANRSAERSPVAVEDVLREFPNGIDLVIDGGPCERKQDSTVVDLVSMPPQILRAGADAEKIRNAIERVKTGKVIRKRILVVCTGNTCRSPMAEGWIRNEIRKNKLSDEIQVKSCGIYARDGASVSMESVLCLKNDEIDIEGFRSRLCRREDVLNADVILAMGQEHARFISDLCPEAKGRIITLDVPDPIGLSLQYYQKCYETIKEKMRKIWPEIMK